MKRVLIIMNYRYNVSCSNTTSKNWTPTAIECYKLGGRCSLCYLYELYFKDSCSKCQMKHTVIELVRKIGAPNTEKGEFFDETNNQY